MILGSNAGVATYSYFSTVSYEKGTILNVPMRSVMEEGIVIDVTPAHMLKTALRAATFSLRKLPSQENPPQLSPILLQTAENECEHLGVSFGATLRALLPEDEFQLSLYTTRELENNAGTRTLREPSVLSDSAHGRTVTLKGIVRESFANKESVLVVAPTRAECERLHKELKPGILDRTVLVGSGFGKRRKEDAVQAITEKDQPILIISTPAYAHIARSDIGTIVLENSRAVGYKMRRRPYVDFTHSLTAFAKLMHARLLYADNIPKTEQVYRVEQDTKTSEAVHLHRLVPNGTIRVVEQVKDNDSREPFKLFAPETLATIEHVLSENGRVFIFCARKGLSSIVGCIDCGTILRDPNTDSPLSLHSTMEDGVEKRWFYSAQSGYRKPASELCPNCGGWRLRERGVGVQSVVRELAHHFPKKTPLLFDSTTASSHKKARAIEAAFFEGGGSILVGTSFAIPYLSQSVDLSVVSSLDSLLALPSWRQAEDALGTLLTLREKTLHTVIVQTRHTTQSDILADAVSGDILAFYTRELGLRKEYQYPPFTHFVLLTYKGKKALLSQIENDLGQTFKDCAPQFYGMPFSDEGLFTRHMLMRFPANEWPKKEISDKLRALPPYIKLEVNPDRIV